MRSVQVIFHLEPEGCWAETPEVPRFSAAADDLEELARLTKEGLVLHLDEDVELAVSLADDTHSVPTFWWTWSSGEYATVNGGGRAATASVGTVRQRFTTPSGQYATSQDIVAA
jgi:predicted RNase H-like HicB family nuclease